MGWLRSELVARFEPAQSARGFAVLDLRLKIAPLERFLHSVSLQVMRRLITTGGQRFKSCSCGQ